MYIIELFFKIKDDIKNAKLKKNQKNIQEETEKCEHLFVPIDSTGTVLACSKCGEICKHKRSIKK